MADRYNVRNVAQKEIYDSYMGILRISPNLVYGVDADDATEMLHTLADFRKEYFPEAQEVKVQVSDSDGNMLPIYFIPRAFSTEVTLRNQGSEYKSIQNIINVCTWSDNSVFVSKRLDIRSTLSLKIKDVKTHKNKSLVTIVSGGQKNTIQNNPQANGILQYPIENPNDDYFFNKDNNKYCIDNNPQKFLFDPNDNTPRHEQMEANLFNQPLSWYQDLIKKEISKSRPDPHVKVGNKFVNTFNVYNEDVPVFYTRDYVLGHYEGHTVKGKEAFAGVRDEWMDSQSKAYDVSFDDTTTFTKLSWIRIDDLIWDAVDEIITGKIRHNDSGRYIDMGAQTNSGTQIVKELFGIGLNEEGKTDLNPQGIGNGSLNETAPILGQGVQPGLIMYHAMPLHRYWFHRCRQIIYNMERYVEMANKLDNVESTTYSDYTNIIDEVNKLLTHKNNNLITSSCRASITPHHSLVKDFLICNGQTVNFENYPNISLTNTNLLKNEFEGKEAELNKTSKKFENRNSSSSISSWMRGTYGAIQKSIKDGNYIKTPNLLSFNETYPRFIRGLSWDTNEVYINNKTATTKDYNINPTIISSYGTDLSAINNSFWIHSDRFKHDEKAFNTEIDELTAEGWFQIRNAKDLWGNQGVNIRKPIRKISLHHYNYDFAAKKANHYHNLFSKNVGGQSDIPFNGIAWENMAAFYTWGCYGGIAFKVAPNESNGGSPHWYNGNEHGSSDYNYGGTYCLALNSNYYDTKGTNAKAWTEYCLNAKSNDTFHDFTPVGNVGLLLWNGDLLNVKSDDDDETYKGTSLNIETDKGETGYYYTTHYTLDFREQDIQNFITEKTYLKGSNFYIGDLKNSNTSADRIRKDRFKRKQQAIKLNEAEGRIPLSYMGNAKYRLEEGHMIERKRSWGSRTFGGDDYDTEPITVYKNKIGNYTLKGINLPSSDSDETDKWGWSCFTSLPLEYPELLGYGDWRALGTIKNSHLKSTNIDCKVSDPATYYINHNVTDRWKKVQPDEKIKVVKYGGVEIKSDTQSPAPNHIYLLPLIRL